MAFITTSAVTGQFVARHSKKCTTKPRVHVTGRRVRMGMGEDGLTEDLKLANTMIANGSTIVEAQEMMTKLEVRRAILAYEVTKIRDVMENLATSLESDDKSLLERAMEAALSIFKPSTDNYPYTGIPSGYSMDKPKHK